LRPFLCHLQWHSRHRSRRPRGGPSLRGLGLSGKRSVRRHRVARPQPLGLPWTSARLTLLWPRPGRCQVPLLTPTSPPEPQCHQRPLPRPRPPGRWAHHPAVIAPAAGERQVIPLTTSAFTTSSARSRPTETIRDCQNCKPTLSCTAVLTAASLPAAAIIGGTVSWPRPR
jgi:hypothetical protein